jgi:DNA polymerase III epsilon subunit-like protein
MSEFQRNVLAMPPDKFKEIENIVSPYTSRPQAEQINFDDSKFYNFLVFDTETNTVNVRYAEICQLSAVDSSSSHTFSEYVLPTDDIDYSASMANNLTIEVINSQRKLLKNGEVVPTLPVNEAITKFESYISQSIERAKAVTNNHVLTVLIGHNSAAFDTKILLRNAGRDLVDKLQSMNVWFADSLTLFRALVKCNFPSLKNSDDTFPQLKLSCLYEALFQQSYVAHDALEDASALHKILFSSRLELTTKTIVDNSRLVSPNHAFNDMIYLDNRHQNMHSFTRIMYNERTNTGLKKHMIEKMSGSGLTYRDLRNVYKRHGKDGLIAILSKPPSSSPSKKPRVTRTERILTTIVEHFQVNSNNLY